MLRYSGESIILPPVLPHAWTRWQYLDAGRSTHLVIRFCVNQVDVAFFFYGKCRSDGSIFWDANLTVLNRQA